MKTNRMLIITAAVFALTANAQVKLNDKNTNAYDLGYGVEISHFLSTASSTTISGEELQQTSATTLAQALYGRLPGLTALSTGGFSGDENKGASFNIRGYHTLNDKSILILVDGYERPIDRLSIEEVESVTVLKDAAATALLGHEGINGAILVKTKRGTKSKTHIKANYSHKFLFNPEFANMADGYQYANALNQARLNDGLTAAYTEQELSLFKNGTDPCFYPNVNWRDLAFRNKAEEDHAYLSIYGGTDKVKYYTNIDYSDARGALKDTKQTDYNAQLRQSKANIRTNLDFNLTSTTLMSVNLFGLFQETKRPSDIGADDATYAIYSLPASAIPFKTTTGIWGGNETYGDSNPIAKIQESGFYKTHQRQLWVDAKLTQKLDFLLKGLSLFVSAGYANSSIYAENMHKAHEYGYERYTGTIGDINNVALTKFGNKETNLTFSNWNDSQWWKAKSNIGINYQHSFFSDDHFSASAIFTNSGSNIDGRGNTIYRQNIMGAFHYDYQNRYIADLILAGNGSNRTYPSKWAFSPTLSLGWIYANTNEALINYGKLRASAGIQHTDYMPTYGMWLPTWDATHGYVIIGNNYNATWGASLGSFPTTDFSQETSTSFNLGTDLRLANVLDLTIDAFYQLRSHIMLSASNENSSVVGIQSSYNDVGEVRSYGFETSMKYAKQIISDLHLNIGATFAWARNEVTRYIGTPTYPLLDPVRHRVNEAWGLKSAGFFKNQADVDASYRQEFSIVTPGDIKYQDLNDDKVINAFDMTSLDGATDIPEINYAFNLGIEYKGIGLNAWFQGTGNCMKALPSAIWGGMANNGNLSVDYYNNCWDMAGDNALYPRLTTQNSSNNNQSSDIWIKPVHFLKMRNIELYYKIPTRLLSHLSLSEAKFYVQGENLLSFDNISTMDAEILSTAYPMFKGVNIGITLTF
ncbi:SusC/RagA family TonB-linked outer membrane protein [Prevotella sp. P6B1]|uniref:SusC/RagA family TonB-linked outer membrane protein n=1 Tax=Prevotella sp. P6B1 TaxID=1410613 RepID=UPI00051BEDAD|nr:SusC/RagA family TonB-linked outer membrane protein [Prevotella sp. P6B1]